MHVQIPQWCEYVAFISALNVRERIACSLDNAIAAIAANTTTDTRIAVSSRGYCATNVSEMCRRVDGQRVVAALHRDLALRHADGLSRDMRRIREAHVPPFPVTRAADVLPPAVGVPDSVTCNRTANNINALYNR
jgi:hypothetical protein